MKKISKKLLSGVVPVLLGTGMIAANGMIVMSHNEAIGEKKEIPVRTAENSYRGEYTESCETAEVMVMSRAASKAAEVKSARTYTALDIKLPKHDKSTVRKAALEEYTMLIQIDIPKETQKAEKTSKKKSKKEEKSGPPAPDAVYEYDATKIYDPDPEEVKLTKTRSIANEYYNVFDERSGTYRTVNGHELLCQMINNEIGSGWADEAIKAQTVAAYCHLRFCDEHGIVPTIGMNADYNDKLEKLVSSVEGQALYYDGSIINAVYSASTAGYSVESERIWDIDYPYLRCVVSKYDKDDPYYGLETVLPQSEVKAALESACGIVMSDNAENWFVPEDIYSGRYVGYINIDGQKRITCRTLQDTFDLKSQALRIDVRDGNVIFRTFGWGHGVGMSQWGAKGYADHGWSYDRILRHYYLDTELKLSESNVPAGADTDSDSVSGENETEETYGLDGDQPLYETEEY